MRLLSISATIALIISVSACSLGTQSRNISPYFDGVIKHSGEPLNDIKILLSLKGDDMLCRHPVQTASTNDKGEFSLIAMKEQKDYIPFMNYTYSEWNVCAQYKGQNYTLYSNNRYADTRLAESVYLNCDLAKNSDKTRCKINR